MDKQRPRGACPFPNFGKLIIIPREPLARDCNHPHLPPAAGSLPQRCDCCIHCQFGVSAPSRSPLLLPLAIMKPHPAQLELIYHPYLFPLACTKDRAVTQFATAGGACFPNFPTFQNLEMEKQRARGACPFPNFGT